MLKLHKNVIKSCMNIGSAVREARKAAGLTQEYVAKSALVSRRAIILLEQTGGRISTLNAVIPVISLKFTGLPVGDGLAAQITRARKKSRLTQSSLAQLAGVSVPTIRSLEAGSGSVASLSAILAVLAPHARRRKHPRASWGTAGDARFTPPEWISAIEAAFGRISLDPCHDSRSFVRADRYIDEREDGLSSKWSGNLAFVNPPFSRHSDWVHRCADAYEQCEVVTVVALLPFRPETAAFHDRIAGSADLIILRGKPRFYDEFRNQMSIAPFPAYFAVWNGDPKDIRKFASHLGATISWALGIERAS